MTGPHHSPLHRPGGRDRRSTHGAWLRLGRCVLLTVFVCGSAGLAAREPPALAQATVPSDVYQYEVAPDDTLIGIAESLLASPSDWRQIRALNHIGEPRRLMPGTRLQLPVALLRQREMPAAVVFLQGQVSAQAKDGPRRALQIGDKVRAGEVLHTGSASTLTLALHDGSRIVVWASSRIRIDRLLSIGLVGIPLVRLGIEQGDAEMRVAPAVPLRRFEVDTPAINLGVRGTEFRTRVDANGVARLEVLEGTVQGRSGAAVLPVTAGMGLLATPGEPLQAPRPLPAPPALQGVAARFERLPLRLAWVPDPGATGYRVQIAPVPVDGLDEAAVRYDGDVVGPALRVADLPDGQWRLRVRAIDALMLQGLDSSVDFIVKARPEPPFTRAPEPAAILRGSQVAFSWARNTAARSYRLQVAERNDADADSAAFPAAPRIDQAGLAGTEFAAELPPGAYRWRVRSVAATAAALDDPGPWGEAQSFTLRPVPQSPALEAPSFDDDGGVLLRWRAPLPGERVQVQVARDDGFATPLLEKSGAIDRVRIADPEPGRYFLRIRSVSDDGFAGPWSAPQQIDVPRSKAWFAIPFLFLLLFAL